MSSFHQGENQQENKWRVIGGVNKLQSVAGPDTSFLWSQTVNMTTVGVNKRAVAASL